MTLNFNFAHSGWGALAYKLRHTKASALAPQHVCGHINILF